MGKSKGLFLKLILIALGTVIVFYPILRSYNNRIRTLQFINTIQSQYCIYSQKNAIDGVVGKKFNRQWFIDRGIYNKQPNHIVDWYINDNGEVIIYTPTLMERIRFWSSKQLITIKQYKDL